MKKKQFCKSSPVNTTVYWGICSIHSGVFLMKFENLYTINFFFPMGRDWPHNPCQGVAESNGHL